MRGENGMNGFLAGIERTLRMRGTLVQRVLCAAMMAALSFARLPGGGYCCQGAMFAVLLRQGFCVPAGFVGVMLGFAAQYAFGELAGCWQLPVCTLLWIVGQTGRADGNGGRGFFDAADGRGSDGRRQLV